MTKREHKFIFHVFKVTFYLNLELRIRLEFTIPKTIQSVECW